MSPDGSSDPEKDKAPEDVPIEADAAEAEPAADGTPAAEAPAGEADAGEADVSEPEPAARKRRRVRKKAPQGEAASEPKARAAKAEPSAPPAKARKAAAGAAKAGEPAAQTPAAAPRRAKASTPARPRRRVVRARARYVRTPARKARMVCVHLPGKSVAQARAILAFTPREVARDWSKLLESAVANAENNHELLEEDLIIREAYADEGPTIKRFRPRAMGRATPIRKRTSHLTITLSARPDQTKRAS
jgi:ribosomal protein L22